VSIHLRVRRMLAYMMRRHARGGRRLLVLGHGGFLRRVCVNAMSALLKPRR
jgi:broad specificity phosphatase PhoE